jgi:hypothetical protein
MVTSDVEYKFKKPVIQMNEMKKVLYGYVIQQLSLYQTRNVTFLTLK